MAKIKINKQCLALLYYIQMSEHQYTRSIGTKKTFSTQASLQISPNATFPLPVELARDRIHYMQRNHVEEISVCMEVGPSPKLALHPHQSLDISILFWRVMWGVSSGGYCSHDSYRYNNFLQLLHNAQRIEYHYKILTRKLEP